MASNMGIAVYRDRDSMRQVVTLALSRPAFEALAGKDSTGGERVPARMEAAIRCYLGDKGSGRPAWRYPAFLRGSEVQVDVRPEIGVDEELWDSFVSEAEEQQVSVQQLFEHAAFYYAAEIDAGRVTQRIIDGFESTGADE